MKPWRFILLFYLLQGFCNPTHPILESGKADFIHPSTNTLLIKASDGAIIRWEDFSIQPHELTRFIQPSKHAWVLNRVTGNHLSEILGQLEANGQVMLLNPHGILFGKDALVEVGGLIATCSEGGIWNREGVKPKGDVKNYGTIRATCGDVVLVGREVRNEGTIEILLKTSQDTLIRSGQVWDRVKAEENPYSFAINCEQADAHCVVSEGGRIILKSDETTLVRGALYGTRVSLLSEGMTVFEGSAHVGSGSIEISGRNGFIHNGSIERKGGTLILDPEADITISKKVNYNYSLEGGTFAPSADIVNISIDKLIEEMGKGPVTITTAYQGEGGGFGSIILKNDVDHSYDSPYPLLLFSSGWGGVSIEGSLTNTGRGAIEIQALLGEVTIPKTLEASCVAIHAQRVHVQGEVYGKEILLAGERGIDLEGLVQVEGGDLTLQSKGSITLRGASVSNIGTGEISIQGLEGCPIQNVNILEGGELFTSCRAKNLSIENVEGTLLIDRGAIHANHTPIAISGAGALQIKEGTLTTHAPISIHLGRHLHLDDGELSTLEPLNITLGESCVLTGNAHILAPGGMTLNAKGDVLLTECSAIQGRGISIVGGESVSLFMNSLMDGGFGPVFISAGKDITFEEGCPKITSGQLQLHAGQYILLENLAELQSKEGSSSITAGLGIYLTDHSRIEAQGGDLNVIASQGNIHLYGTSLLSSKTHGATIIAGKSLIMENFAKIETLGETGTTIVVDHHCSGGGLVTTPKTAITSGESPLRIFTAKRSLNSIQGTLNGHHLAEAPLYLSTTAEKWGMDYPNLFFHAPFTLFHKEDGLITLFPGGITQKDFTRVLINYIGPYTAELFRDLHPYDAFIKQNISFQDRYSPPHPFLENTYNFIRQTTQKDRHFLLLYSNNFKSWFWTTRKLSEFVDLK